MPDVTPTPGGYSITPKKYDAATTQHMLSTFDAAEAECRSIHQGVDNAAGQLMGIWQGQASARFNSSMNEWLTGFRKVEAALLSLNGSMDKYRTITNNTESNNATLGSGWANGGH